MQTAIDRAKQLVEQERHKSREELIELWKGRRDSAWHWWKECGEMLLQLGEADDALT